MTVERAKSELMQIYGALSPDKQRAIDTLVKIEPKTEVSEYDKDHIWYKGGQYISLRRFLEVKAEAEQEPIEVEATKLQMAYNQGFEDCRKAVIDELKKWDWQELYLPIHFKENIIDVIPSVKPQEPKTGHWTHDGSRWKNRFICSECGYKLFDEPTNYCPNCGCVMKGELE